MGLFSFFGNVSEAIKFSNNVSKIMKEIHKDYKSIESLQLMEIMSKESPEDKYFKLFQNNKLRMDLLKKYNFPIEELRDIYKGLCTTCGIFKSTNEFIPIMAVCEIDILEDILSIWNDPELSNCTKQEKNLGLAQLVMTHYKI